MGQFTPKSSSFCRAVHAGVKSAIQFCILRSLTSWELACCSARFWLRLLPAIQDLLGAIQWWMGELADSAVRLAPVYYNYCTQRAVQRVLSQNSWAKSDPSTRSAEEGGYRFVHGIRVSRSVFLALVFWKSMVRNSSRLLWMISAFGDHRVWHFNDYCPAAGRKWFFVAQKPFSTHCTIVTGVPMLRNC